MVSQIALGDETYPVACNAFTPIVFSRSFSVERDDGTKRPKDINEDVSLFADVMRTAGMPPILALVEIFYACAKTANPKLGGFEDWLGNFPADAFDLERGDGWASDVTNIVIENFFPRATEHVETSTAEASDPDDAEGAVE